MAVDLLDPPLDVTQALPTTLEQPAGRRPGIVLGALALVLLLAVAAVFATWPQPADRPVPAPDPQPGTQQGAANGSPQRAVPSAAVPGARAGSAPSPAPAPSAAAQQSAAATSATPWTTRDSAVLSASTAAYFVAGTIYGDPPANRPGVVTMSSSTLTHLRRGGKSGPTLLQLRQAVQALGGRVTISQGKSGGGKAAFSLAAGHSIVLDSHGWVRVNGVDAFGLRRTATGWTSTATGPQVRAFLAGYIEGEGSVGGKVGDDPTAAHLAFVQALLSTSQAYGVRSVLTGTRYFALTVASKADFPKVQAYPFSTYSRVPGGKP